MTIIHHPSLESLVAHAAGNLDPLLMPVLSLHLDYCEHCRQQQRQAVELGAALFAQANDADASSFDLERNLSAVMRRIDRPPTGVPRPPGFLERFSPSGLHGIAWRQVTPKVALFEFPELSGDGRWLRLYRFQPGTRVPQHRHSGEEFSVVLRGSYVESDSRFAVGDFSEADTTTRHAQQVDGDTVCIALIATTGKIAFDSVRDRFAARLLGLS